MGKLQNSAPKVHLAGLGLLLSFVSMAALSGCTAIGIGDEQFSCPLDENGNCASSWEIYEASNNGQVPFKNVDEEGRLVTGSEGTAVVKNGNSDFVLDNYVTPRLPNEPIPVRTPPQVMRIWIAPYEDVEGDFIVGGYVFTEIQPRRWTLGVNSSTDSADLYQPLNNK
ncbi:MAG TPA: type IV conjugative transfer system protein TraV [Succinivibrionaceae bacterium]|nr:type IV conjugative transfer system protein TraV [Succinivibrionaceae bacterium]